MNAMKALIKEYLSKPFTSEEINGRKRLLNGLFNSAENAKKQVKWIWGDY